MREGNRKAEQQRPRSGKFPMRKQSGIPNVFLAISELMNSISGRRARFIPGKIGARIQFCYSSISTRPENSSASAQTTILRLKKTAQKKLFLKVPGVPKEPLNGLKQLGA